MGFLMEASTSFTLCSVLGGCYTRKLLLSTGALESMKTQTPSTKLQTNIKFQYSMTKTGLVRRRRIGHCDLFDICDLEFLVTPADYP
jgi:hypothetical protein